ncbi:MAG: hypothetical protein DMG12_28070 [Acidobacteria bacterium]|nr:MAG: hypothetical protein DMG12_28070 [Acidobacteriota bacterium]
MKILQHRIADALQGQIFRKALLKDRICNKCADFVMGTHTTTWALSINIRAPIIEECTKSSQGLRP